ncbi:MAG: glycosyltransferase family 1 protein, partial [Zetaproteobacteria bacterium]
WKPAIYGAWAGRLAKVPARIHALAGMGFVASSSSFKARLLRQLLSRMLRTAADAHFIVQNPEDLEMLRRWLKLPRTRLHLIRGSGVDIQKWKPLPEPPEPPVVFVLPARMLWTKGVGEFVEALRILKRRGLPVEGWLVGGVDEENPSRVPKRWLEERAEEGIVRWLGHVQDIRSVWEQAHVAVLPSYREGLPKALLEAAACARPLIATDAPGCREVVRNGETGLLVPARDPEALAEAIAKLAMDKEGRRRMGACARMLVEQEFSLERVIRETLALYEHLASMEGAKHCAC